MSPVAAHQSLPQLTTSTMIWAYSLAQLGEQSCSYNCVRHFLRDILHQSSRKSNQLMLKREAQ
jgi:hypothetical protein